MTHKTARRALADSAIALAAGCGAIAMFLPPMLESTVSSVLRIVALGLAIAVALPLHWVLLGMAAHRMQRSVVGWVACAVLLFPVGGAAALILLSWLAHEEPQGLPAASH
ncbi:hypothetical protein [Aquabacterium sp.]|uniref:hypothetical protein n=1 Tax=Aquabacterium sp. TaxID=1872578 RepID=UPI002C0F5E6D|nr:hypothetical protein [Aquabacterium sp.]HSW07224.1 hypothetical protein [Aquabacterium sp.]